mgnify:FL=1
MATVLNADKFSAASYEILAGIFVGIFIVVADILQEFFAVIADILGLLRILCSSCFVEPAV